MFRLSITIKSEYIGYSVGFVKNDIQFTKFLPKSIFIEGIIDKELALEAVKVDNESIKRLPKVIFDKDLAKSLINYDINTFEFIPKELIDYEMAKYIIEKYPLFIQHIRDDIQN